MRYFINTVIISTALLMLVGATLVAYGQQEELETSVVVVHQYDFGNTKHDLIDLQYVITNTNPEDCVTKAQEAQTILQDRERLSVLRVNRTNWGEPKSTVTCVSSTHSVPIQTVSTGVICITVWDEVVGNYVSQLDQLCSMP